MNTLSYQERLNRVLRHIESHLDDRHDLDALAKIACFSPYHFHRIFTAMTGESVAAYARRLRLQRATVQISYSDESITQIAFHAGYDSIDAFSRAFRTQFGMSPSEYRRSGNPWERAQRQTPGAPLFCNMTPDLPPLEVNIIKFPAILTVAARYTGAYMESGPVWEKVFHAMQAHDLLRANTVGYGVTHDNPDVTPPCKCRMEVCFGLPAGMTADTPAVQAVLSTEGLYLKSIGGTFDYAATRIKGPYTQLLPAYRSLYGEWLPQSGREPAHEPNFEAYYNNPEATAAQNLLTSIFVPLKPL